jgi:hypothetical protein
MPKQYAREFRRAICQRLVAGERVSSLSREVGGVSEGLSNTGLQHLAIRGTHGAFVDRR